MMLWGEAREKQRDACGVILERSAEARAKIALLVAHDGVIENAKIDRDKRTGDPGMSRNDKARREECAAAIERIARPCVRAGRSELAILAQVARGGSADGETSGSDDCAVDDRAKRRRSKQPVGDGDEVSCANAPAHPELALTRRAHGQDSRRRPTASRT